MRSKRQLWWPLVLVLVLLYSLVSFWGRGLVSEASPCYSLMVSKQLLASENAELKLQKETLASENENLKRELAQEARAVTPVEFSKASSTAVKVKKEQNVQTNRKVEDLHHPHPPSSGSLPPAAPSTPSTSSFRRHDGVVIVTKVHGHPTTIEMTIQMICLLTAAYNQHVQYDIVQFTTMPWPAGDVAKLKAVAHPARVTLVQDAGSVAQELMALNQTQRTAFLKFCNTTMETVDWFTHCAGDGCRLNYGWQAEFRSKQIWTHPALQKYRYMLWMDTDAFATQPWEMDPVGLFIRNNLVILFDHFGQGAVKTQHHHDVFQQAFNTTICSLRIRNGTLDAKTALGCRKKMGLIHGFLHITDLDFYRTSRVQNFVNLWIGDTKYRRGNDDQGAVTAPPAFLAPDRAWDMRSHGIRLNVLHNLVLDGQNHDKLKDLYGPSAGPGFLKYWKSNFSTTVFPASKKMCAGFVKHSN